MLPSAQDLAVSFLRKIKWSFYITPKQFDKNELKTKINGSHKYFVWLSLWNEPHNKGKPYLQGLDRNVFFLPKTLSMNRWKNNYVSVCIHNKEDGSLNQSGFIVTEAKQQTWYKKAHAPILWEHE